MKWRILVAVSLSMLMLTPAHAQKAPGWEQDPVLHGLATAHASRERLHERWLPGFEVDWERQRARVVDILCDLGVIALALVECSWASSADAARLAPPPAAEHPDVEAFRQRPIEARMRSI